MVAKALESFEAAEELLAKRAEVRSQASHSDGRDEDADSAS